MHEQVGLFKRSLSASEAAYILSAASEGVTPPCSPSLSRLTCGLRSRTTGRLPAGLEPEGSSGQSSRGWTRPGVESHGTPGVRRHCRAVDGWSAAASLVCSLIANCPARLTLPKVVLNSTVRTSFARRGALGKFPTSLHFGARLSASCRSLSLDADPRRHRTVSAPSAPRSQCAPRLCVLRIFPADIWRGPACDAGPQVARGPRGG